MWRGLKPDLDRFFVLLHVVPFAERVPALRDYLNQDFALRDWRHSYRTVLVRLEIEFGELVVMHKAAFRVKTDIHAGVADRLTFVIQYAQMQFSHARFLGVIVPGSGGAIRRAAGRRRRADA